MIDVLLVKQLDFSILIYFSIITIFLYCTARGHGLLTDGSYDYYRYHKTVTGETAVVVGIQACSDGHIGLSEVPGLSSLNMYEVVIGGWSNSKSVIRRARQGHIEVEASTPDILSCNSMKFFWVTWEDGIIEVGAGGIIGQTRLLYFKDPDPYTVNSITLATAGGHEGIFAYGQNTGSKNIV